MKRSARTARFLAIGWLGFFVQTVTLACLTSVARWSWLPATCVAVEASIVHNYFWHETWTWKDRVAAMTIASRCVRFARYNVATGLVAIGGNVVLTALYLALLHSPAIVANTLAVATLTIVNFFVADRWIFKSQVASLKFQFLFLVTCYVFLFASPVFAQPSPETIHAWDRYVAQTEARIERTRAVTAPLSREALAERGDTSISGETVDVPSGAIHHWRGAVFVPRVTIDRMLGDLLHPGHDVPQQEDVAESRVLSRSGDSIRTYIRLVRRAIVMVSYDTEHEMTFRRWSPTLATARSVATSIRETDGGDHGFLWRLNSYWRYRQVDGGVIVELESITLSRSIPSVVRPIAMPIVHHIARESMERTLAAFRSRFS